MKLLNTLTNNMFILHERSGLCTRHEAIGKSIVCWKQQVDVLSHNKPAWRAVVPGCEPITPTIMWMYLSARWVSWNEWYCWHWISLIGWYYWAAPHLVSQLVQAQACTFLDVNGKSLELPGLPVAIIMLSNNILKINKHIN